MLTFFYDYGFFILKLCTIFAVLGIGVLFIFKLFFLRSSDDSERFEVQISSVNDRHRELVESLELDMMDEKESKKAKKAQEKLRKQEEKEKEKDKEGKNQDSQRFFVLHFDGDVEASAVECLRREISILLELYQTGDEVILCLDNSGGYVHAHGLAASQLLRLKQKKIPLTICVDMVAASGGYLMACVADRIVSAPFAMIGSIGVMTQVPNFHKLLKKFDSDYEVLTAGKYKRTMTMFGENTEESREKVKEELQLTHELFKDFILAQRPKLSSDELNQIATGEVWYGSQALALGLVDEIKTSDEWILEQMQKGEVFELEVIQHQSFREKFHLAIQNALFAYRIKH